MSQLNPFEDHPDEFTIASYLEGRLPEEASATLEAHLADCDDCRRGLVLLRGLDQLEEDEVPRELLESPRKRRGLSWAALAAAALLGALLVLPLTEIAPPGSGGGPVYRDAGTRGPGLLSPAAGAVVGRNDLLFRWTPVAGADHYRVRVWSSTDDFSLEFDVLGGQTESGWPENRPPAPAGELVWRVQALALNRTIAESPPAPFQVGE